MTDVPPITTARLRLVSMSLEFLEACLKGDREQAERLIGLRVPEEWLNERWLIELRLKDLQQNPTFQRWLLRAVELRDTGEMVGHVGFHTPPGPEYLDEFAPGGIEMGYTIYPSYRRQGYAREAVSAMIAWASEQGVPRFVLSISPENTPSRRIAEQFGFVQVGSQIDEIDGQEDVFVRERVPSVKA